MNKKTKCESSQRGEKETKRSHKIGFVVQADSSAMKKVIAAAKPPRGCVPCFGMQ